MNLEQKIMAELKTAMLAKDEKTTRALRAIKAAIILAKTAEGAGGELKEEDEIKMLAKNGKATKRFIGNITSNKTEPTLHKKNRKKLK